MQEITFHVVAEPNEPKIIKRPQTPIRKIKTGIKNTTEKLKKQAALNSEISKFVDKWLEVMASTRTYNAAYHTFTLKNIKKEPYGWSCKIYVPYGLSFDKLDTIKPIIENNIPCILNYKAKRLKNFVEAEIITTPLEEVPYKRVKAKPYEVYVGTGYDKQPVIVSMLKYPHIIDTGATGMGKTKMIDNIIINLALNCSDSEIGLFLIQIDKADQAVYRRLKQTMAYANTIEKALAVTNYLCAEVKKRNELIGELIEDGIGDNIHDYNEKYPGDAFPYYYVIIDEYSSLMPDERANDKEILAAKKKIQSNMEYIAQVGRSAGVYIIIGLQRATIDKLPSFVKAMMNVIVSFRQVNQKSSEIAIDTNEAVFLEPREAIMKITDIVYFRTTTLSNRTIVRLIDRYRIPADKYVDPFNYDKWLPKNQPKQQPPKNKQEQGKIKNSPPPPIIKEKTKEEILAENIAKIPNFVPYQEIPKDAVIIDKRFEGYTNTNTGRVRKHE